MPELPQEIIDTIIDEIWASSCPRKTSTLRSCSLSARCFLYRARTHLFREIHLYNRSPQWSQSSEQANGFHCLRSQFKDMFIHSSIPLDCIVRSLHLHGNPGFADSLEEWLKFGLAEVLGALGQLECLTFHSFNMAGATSVPLAPNVTHVAFHQVYFNNINSLAHYLRQFPSMESLHFSATNLPRYLEAVIGLDSLRALSLEDMNIVGVDFFPCLLRSTQLRRFTYHRKRAYLLRPHHPELPQISCLLHSSTSITDLTVNMCWLTVDPFNRGPLLPLSNLTSLNVTLLMNAISDLKRNTESIQFCDARVVSFLLDSLSLDTTYSLETITLSLNRVWSPPDILQDHHDLWSRIGSSLASPGMPYLARVRIVDRETGRPVWSYLKVFQDVKQSPGFALLERRRVLDMEEPAEWEKSVSPWRMG